MWTQDIRSLLSIGPKDLSPISYIVIFLSYLDQELKFFSCKQCFGTLLRSPGFNFIRQTLIDNKVFTSVISIVWCRPQPTLGADSSHFLSLGFDSKQAKVLNPRSHPLFSYSLIYCCKFFVCLSSLCSL